MATATKTTGLCAACQARRSNAAAHPDQYTARTTAEAPDVPADRDHKLTIVVWAACSDCSGRTR